jgi:hypothetical protein
LSRAKPRVWRTVSPIALIAAQEFEGVGESQRGRESLMQQSDKPPE